MAKKRSRSPAAIFGHFQSCQNIVLFGVKLKVLGWETSPYFRFFKLKTGLGEMGFIFKFVAIFSNRIPDYVKYGHHFKNLPGYRDILNKHVKNNVYTNFCGYLTIFHHVAIMQGISFINFTIRRLHHVIADFSQTDRFKGKSLALCCFSSKYL